MYCSNCGCSSAKEVVLFSSVAIDCWACNLNDEIRKRLLDASESFTITLPTAIHSVPVIIKVPDHSGDIRFTVYGHND